jgi:hypothetical protein
LPARRRNAFAPDHPALNLSEIRAKLSGLKTQLTLPFALQSRIISKIKAAIGMTYEEAEKFGRPVKKIVGFFYKKTSRATSTPRLCLVLAHCPGGVTHWPGAIPQFDPPLVVES